MIRLKREPAAVVEHVICSHVVLNVAMKIAQIMQRLAANYNVTKQRNILL